ncbi:MAG TPA: amylo-alpha-1,6-glucosidase [Myxococcales bacterium]|nr:amylo-alpha-1,6-glucosidase [Myxococcales bacterium]
MLLNDQDEWLEADGLGGFASGTVSGVRTRRYHALLLAATTPPSGRTVLVNGVEAWIETAGGAVPLSTQRYVPDVIHPDGVSRLRGFTSEPWPAWTYRVDGCDVTQELFVARGTARVVLSWKATGAGGRLPLRVRPLLSGRDFHSLHHENAGFSFAAAEAPGGGVAWRPYGGLPGVVARGNGRYRHAPDWYRRFQYDRERERGLDFEEDLASPGVFEWDLDGGAAWLSFEVAGAGPGDLPALRDRERARRASLGGPQGRAVEAYLVRRGEGTTIIAGYPWFGDWGRDTFIALRGLCLAQRRLTEAREILVEWSRHVSDGMLPNRFPDSGEAPEYNSVDAALWFVVAVHETFAAAAEAGQPLGDRDARALLDAVEAILDGHVRGTRAGIHVDRDGLLAAGTRHTQLTWMDACYEGRPVTPRAGKAVEVQALWLNALWLQARTAPRWRAPFEAGRKAFLQRFWNEQRGCLFDVVDAEGRAGSCDATLRPNQIFAVGGLPLQLVTDDRARRIVEAVEARLWTPLGLRSLDPDDPDYLGRYQGTLRERDEAYHQGTAWVWLAGPFIEAWLRVHGSAAKEDARRRFLAPLIGQLEHGGMGHLPEIADGDPPHAPRGCPFQAWSLGELLRVRAMLEDPS